MQNTWGFATLSFHYHNTNFSLSSLAIDFAFQYLASSAFWPFYIATTSFVAKMPLGVLNESAERAAAVARGRAAKDKYFDMIIKSHKIANPSVLNGVTKQFEVVVGQFASTRDGYNQT